MKTCNKCNIELTVGNNWLLSQKKISNYICNSCKRKSRRDYYKDHKETELSNRREYNKKWKLDNKVHVSSYNKKYLSSYYVNNKHIYVAHSAKRRSIKLKATPEWADLEKIKLVYEKAKWLESITGLKYHVDHVIPLQGDNICGLHIWENLQILEKSINLSKRNKF